MTEGRWVWVVIHDKGDRKGDPKKVWYECGDVADFKTAIVDAFKRRIGDADPSVLIVTNPLGDLVLDEPLPKDAGTRAANALIVEVAGLATTVAAGEFLAAVYRRRSSLRCRRAVVAVGILAATRPCPGSHLLLHHVLTLARSNLRHLSVCC